MRSSFAHLAYVPMPLSRSFIFKRFEDPGDPVVPPAGGGGQPDLAAQAASLAQRHGGSDAALVILLNENFTLRETRRQLEGRVPAEGSVVLAGDDLARWQAYQALGAPTDVQTAIAERDTFRTTLTVRERADMVRDAATATGYSEKVLGRMVGDLAITVREVEEAGKKVKRAFVKDGDTELPLTQYAEREWADVLPALKEAKPSGTRFIPQNPGGGNESPLTAVEAHLERQRKAAEARVSPLKKR